MQILLKHICKSSDTFPNIAELGQIFDIVSQQTNNLKCNAQCLCPKHTNISLWINVKVNHILIYCFKSRKNKLFNILVYQLYSKCVKRILIFSEIDKISPFMSFYVTYKVIDYSFMSRKTNVKIFKTINIIIHFYHYVLLFIKLQSN